MPLDSARWQIDILAADKTATAFTSVDRRMKGLEATQARIGSSMSQGFALASRALGPLVAGLTAAAAAQKLFEAGMKAADLGEQAEQVGVTTDQLQAFRLSAAQAGVTVEEFDAALMKLAKAAGTAAEGNDEMIARFDKLGVKLLDSQKQLRPVGDLMPELARGLLQIGSSTERSAAMMELFGRSGARLRTVLEDLARGNEAVIASARGMGGMVSPEAIKSWDDLADRMKVSQLRWDALMANWGARLALPAIDHLNGLLASTSKELETIERLWNAIQRNMKAAQLDAARAPQVTAQNDVKALQERLEAERQRLQVNPNSQLAQASVAALEAQIARAQEVERRVGAIVRQSIMEGDEASARLDKLGVVEPGATTGTDQPKGKTAGAAAAKLDERLQQLQNERGALERALAAFDVRGTQTVDEVERRLNAQVALDKKLFDVLKDVPPNSPLAQQLIQEATAVSQLNQKLDERKRLLGDAERVIQQFGDGSAIAARETARLNEMLAAGAIDAGTFARAMEDLNRRTADQERAARGAAGGWGGFIAGIEQGMADMSRANSSFELGRRSLQSLDEVIDALAGTSNKTFGQIALDFGMMLLKMEASAQASNLFNLLRGSGPTNQGILGGLLGGGGGGLFGVSDGFGGLFGGSSFGGMSFAEGLAGGILPLAGGGDYQAGRPRLTGEEGWELDIPRRPGTILNQDQLGGLGGPSVNMAVTMNFGSDVDRATLDNWGNTIMARVPGLAVQAILDAKSSDSRVRNALRIK